MKKLFFIALLVAGNTVFAQDYCKQLKKEVTENNTSFTYETPYDENNPPLMRAVRSYSTDPKNDFDNFNIILTIPCEFADLLSPGPNGESEKEESGIVIEFADKSKIEEDIAISHDKKGDGTAARIAYLPITGDSIKEFVGKKVAKIYLAKASATVPADMATAIQAYMKCLKDTHKM